ncbi:MAG: PAS domain-containing protein [Rhodospirillales bacterium]|nr:PAS domain-containing protein [Rhodospirillales bacterium]
MNANADAQNETGGAAPKRKVNWIVIACAAGLVIGIALAVVFSFRFVEDERRRDLQEWQIRLGIVADSRVADVQDWIAGNFKTLRDLTQNASLQLYMTELGMAGDEDAGETISLDAPSDLSSLLDDGEDTETEQEAEAPREEEEETEPVDTAAVAGYLRNLLVATADRTGFKPPEDDTDVAANIEKAGVAGLGLVDAAGAPIVSTPGMPPIAGKIRAAIAQALEGEPALIDVFMGASNQPTIGFALPVYGIQEDEGAAGIGAVVGIRILDDNLFQALVQPGETSETAETYLVRAQANTVEYLSPLADGTPALKRALAADTLDLAAAYAIEKPGGFGIRKDYSGEEVLVVSRPVANAPWVLVRKIPRAEALAANETRLKTILIVFVLIIVGVTIAIIAVWRHGTSVRAAEAAERFRVSSERFENISKFMRVVTNSQPLSIVAVTGETVYTFANEPAAHEAGIETGDMIGKTMASVIGPVQAGAYSRINRQVLADFEVADKEDPENSRDTTKQSHLHEFGEGDDVKVVKSDHVPLRGDRDHPPGILMVLNDITELTVEKRRSERMLGQLIDTLVGVVDRRNPFATHASSRTAEVAKAIAAEMDIPENEIKTVDVAGKLAGVGTVFVPTAVLTKPTELTPEEQQMIDGAYRVSADILRQVPFDGPVVKTIKQSGERWDGRGPLGIQGEDILRPARIVAVATAFMEMVSANARRGAMTFDEAAKILQDEAGSRFDRRPVSALINILHNRDGIKKWAPFRKRPEIPVAE